MSWSTEKTEFTRDNGLMISARERAMRDTVTETLTKVTLWEEKLTEKEFILGLMEKSMTENGPKESKRAMECGGAYLETAIWVSGRIVRLTDMEFISGRMATATKVVGTIASSMAKVQTSSQMATHTQVITSRANLKVKESTNGKTAVFTQATSNKV